MTDCYDTTINGQQCHVCPAITAVPGVPAQTVTERIYGWNAGAESATSIVGPCYTQFELGQSIGIVVALAPARISNDPRDAGFGWYVYEQSGKRWRVIVEKGVKRGSPVAIADGASPVYRIERDGEYMRYFVDTVLIRSAAVAPRVPLRVVSCLYASGDEIK